MKQVAGKMRLDLAKYRELAAFAQFSSDLDPKTKASLDRGARVSAILNQMWDEPMGVEEQVAVIYAATNGFLDRIQLKFVKDWEQQFLFQVKRQEPGILQSIKKEAKITEDTEFALKKFLGEFTESHSEWHL